MIELGEVLIKGQVQVLASTVSIEELVAQIMLSRKITRGDQQHLMSSLLSKDLLDEQERILIDRVFYGVRHGLLRVVD